MSHNSPNYLVATPEIRGSVVAPKSEAQEIK